MKVESGYDMRTVDIWYTLRRLGGMSNTTETTMKSKTFLLTGLMSFAASATTVVITSPDGGRAVANTYGARLVSWRPADGEEVFVLPKPYDKCPREAGVQIHGGLPIYWPWFVFEGPEGCKTDPLGTDPKDTKRLLPENCWKPFTMRIMAAAQKSLSLKRSNQRR